jgi:hypothetical protein
VKLVMTLLVRDEADVVDEQIAFHLAAGVDLVVAMDHRSQDGTTEILERYAREGTLQLLRQESELLLDGDWRTELARVAATEHGADWILSSDADEFWWPRGGSLKEVLAAVPARYGVLGCLWRDFPYRPGNEHFAERMTVRLSLHGPLNDERGPYHVNQKVAFRGDPDVQLPGGQHDVHRHRQPKLRGWFPIEVLHFPIRSRDQAERKFGAAHEAGLRAMAAGVHDRPLAKHRRAAGSALADGRFDDWLRDWTVDDARCERGLADGWLSTDLRVRDALRRLRSDAPIAHVPEPPDAALVDDLGRLGDADALTQAGDHVDLLERRLATVEAELRWDLRARARPGVRA